MVFRKENVYTDLNVDEIRVGDKGYFAHDILTLKQMIWDNEPTSEYTGRSPIGYLFDETGHCYPFFYLVEEVKTVVPMNLEEILSMVRDDSGFVKYRDDNNSIHVFQLERLDFDDPNPLTVNGICYTIPEFVNKFTMLNGWRFEKNN